jgi:hypothetical protein
MPIPAGNRIGVYEVVGLLGAGGKGEVYLRSSIWRFSPMAIQANN